MIRNKKAYVIFAILSCYIISLFLFNPSVSAVERKVYDGAGLLTDSEIASLEELANRLGEERETYFIIVTTNEAGIDVMEYTGDFYDEMVIGNDNEISAAILTVDMSGREIYLAGFYKAETYLDDGRMDKIRKKITPDMSAGYYYEAFKDFIILSHEYMGYEPGFNPDNILFNPWFQILVSIGAGALVVGMMAFNMGGRVTVNARTYMDANTSRVLHRKDQYLRTTVTKRKKPSQKSGGGGGGGISRGGHSHSGSRGGF